MAGRFSIHRSTGKKAVIRDFLCFASLYIYITAYAVVLAQEADLSSPVTAPAPRSSSSPTTPVPAEAPPQQTLHEEVVGALRATRRYGAIAGVIDTDGSIIHQGITLFAPTDEALITLNGSGHLVELMKFYIVPEIYPFSDLLRLQVGTRLPTSVDGFTIPVTSIALDRYGLDNADVIDPDLYTDGTIAVHGINAMLLSTSDNYNGVRLTPGEAPTLVPTAAPLPWIPTAKTAKKKAPVAPPAEIIPGTLLAPPLYLNGSETTRSKSHLSIRITVLSFIASLVFIFALSH